jgi:hypothetical protein
MALQKTINDVNNIKFNQSDKLLKTFKSITEQIIKKAFVPSHDLLDCLVKSIYNCNGVVPDQLVSLDNENIKNLFKIIIDDYDLRMGEQNFLSRMLDLRYHIADGKIDYIYFYFDIYLIKNKKFTLSETKIIVKKEYCLEKDIWKNMASFLDEKYFELLTFDNNIFNLVIEKNGYKIVKYVIDKNLIKISSEHLEHACLKKNLDIIKHMLNLKFVPNQQCMAKLLKNVNSNNINNFITINIF